MEWDAVDAIGENLNFVLSEIANCNGCVNCEKPVEATSSKEVACGKAL
jgi:hypothetical protein